MDTTDRANRNKEWSPEELIATVEAYASAYQREEIGEEVSLMRCYQELATRFGRSSIEYAFRFKNISSILAYKGLPSLTSVKGAVNLESPAIDIMTEAIQHMGLFMRHLAASTEDPVQLEGRVRELMRKGLGPEPPKGSDSPLAGCAVTTRIARDPMVKAWILTIASGRCECCLKSAPFLKTDGMPYLEVHHLRRLADGGSDTISNTVAVCPNCHRQLHFGSDSTSLAEQMLARLSRLRAE